MQIVQLVTCALALFSSPVLATKRHLHTVHKNALSRTTSVVSPAPASLGLRQHHPTREFHDTCAYIDADILDNLSILGIPLDLDLDLCICLSLLPLLISANVQLEALVPLLGLNELIAKLTIVVNEAPNGQQCTYPPHSYAICSKDNPCGIGCDAPYVEDCGQCVCPPPLVSCNGVCGSFPHGCGSSSPQSWGRRSNGLFRRRIDNSGGVMTFTDAQATCKKHETVCGVYGGSATGFECLDTNTQLESCGGCTVSNPFFPAAAQNATATGRDCSAIAGVSDVACIAGRCDVRNCAPGWAVRSDGEGCVEGSEPGAFAQMGAQAFRAQVRDTEDSE